MSVEKEYTPDINSSEEEIILENFDIFCEKNIKDILYKESVEINLTQVKERVDEILGEKQNLGKEKINIYLFSDRSKYENFLKSKFPDRFGTYIKDNAIFDRDPSTLEKTIVKFGSTKLSKQELTKIKDYGMNIEEAKEAIAKNARADILSAIAHEMVHLHPFFGGVGNEASPTKWEQEMVCEFIGEKIRAQFGNRNFRQTLFKQAQEELKRQKELNLENDGLNWKKFNNYEQFFYPYLEKRYGLEKLQILWRMLFKEPKKSLSEALQNVYGKNINDIERKFKSEILTANNHSEIEI